MFWEPLSLTKPENAEYCFLVVYGNINVDVSQCHSEGLCLPRCQ
jgi:hypothetical protein